MNMAFEKKLAILSSSNARKDTWKEGGNELDSSVASPMLLGLLALGFRVIVVSTRAAWVPRLDGCWMDLVQPEDCILTPGEWANSPERLETWKGVFQKLGLQTPKEQTPRTWLDFRHAASEQGVFVGYHEQAKELGLEG
jgi:hypothetical protein